MFVRSRLAPARLTRPGCAGGYTRVTLECTVAGTPYFGCHAGRRGSAVALLAELQSVGAEAGFTACERAVLAHGGMGYAKEFHVERLMREVMINRIAPVSQQLVLSY